MPYAKPPTGPLRFRPSQPVAAWEGVRPAKRFGPAFAQVFDAHESILEELTDEPAAASPLWVGSEDALTLNIWTPGCDVARRPVIVYLHGGANWLESSRCGVYHGARLSAHGDAVVASLNYRLGLFGFLDLSPLGPDAPAEAHSHGLVDQLLALRWIKANAAAFGGDPDNITVVGESAGAMDISWLIASGQLQGLARRAALMSGAGSVSGFGQYPGHSAHGTEEGKRRAAEFWRAMDIADFDALRALPTDALLSRHAAIAASSDILFESDTLFYPRAGGAVARDPFWAVNAGAARGIDLLIGFTSYEMGLWLLWDNQLDQRDCGWAALNLPGFPPRLRGEAAALYDELFAHESPGVRAMHLLGDAMFVAPSLILAEAQARAGGKAYVYQFDLPGADPRKRALHAADQPFFFGTHDTPGALALMGAGDAAQRDALSRDMMDRLIRFARGAAPWTAYGLDSRISLNFAQRSEERPDQFGARWRWWREMIAAPALGWA